MYTRRCGIGLLLVGLATMSCQTAYYGAMEKMGFHKRDILVDRVKDARNAQEAAKEQFRSALEQFSAVVRFEGGELQKTYDKLSREYEASEKRAQAVRDRVSKVDEVASALFREWKSELKQYQSGELRRASQEQFRQTQAKYEQLIGSMREASSKMDPVLAAFRDQVLFLKHNLNSRAIASIQAEATDIEIQVASLIRDMESSIAEADAFIRDLMK
jgi:hypothetical protein